MNYGAEYDLVNYSNYAFFKNYKKFIDYRGDSQEDYKKRIQKLNEKLKNVNFKKNAIIFCKQPIFKDVCLVGAGRLDKLVDSEYLGLSDLVDIFDGFRTDKNLRVDSDDIYYSNGDIKQPLLAIHVNYDGKPGFGPFVLYQCVARRLDKIKNSITWIFVYGDVSTLNDDYFNYLNRLRNDPYMKSMFEEIDLNRILGTDNIKIPIMSRKSCGNRGDFCESDYEGDSLYDK